MPYRATVYRVLIASPSDLAVERRLIRQIVFGWNDLNAIDMQTVLLPVMWETHALPEMGDRAQALINKQIVNNADILIGVFWTRLGTPTGREASGTVEEIQEFLLAKRPVLLYFSNAPAPPANINPDQYHQLREFKRECRRQGIVFDYDSTDELGELLARHLLATVRRLQEINV